MFAFPGRIVFVLPILLALVTSARAEEGDEHLVMGNPSGATADKGKPDNYLVRKRQYVLSYNSSKGTPNQVSWHLSKKWLGKTHRTDPFAPDTTLPAGFFVVRPNDYRAGGFDRGHLCPAADRSVSKEDMDATFLMANMMPQAPNLNRITWGKLEAYCREQVREGDNDLYIVAGPAGRGGVGSDGDRKFLQGQNGKIVVPGKCWKVVLCVPAGTTDPRKVTAEARVFAVIMPNLQGLSHDWRTYAVPVKDVEKLTGFTFFGNVPPKVAEQLRSRKPQTRAKPTTPGTKEEKPPRKGAVAGELPTFESGCIIGNRKSKIYHVADSRGYETAKKSKNAIFFRTVKAAEKAGYTAAKR
jgi:endonuclease G